MKNNPGAVKLNGVWQLKNTPIIICLPGVFIKMMEM